MKLCAAGLNHGFFCVKFHGKKGGGEGGDEANSKVVLGF